VGRSSPRASFVSTSSTEQKSSVVEEERPYICFCHRGSTSPQPVVSSASECDGIDRILALVLQITSDFGFEKSGVVDATVSLSLA
jgi:hypothetical protein